MIRFYPIAPVAKPRMTQRDKWRKRAAVLVYRAFCDECRLRGVTLPSEYFHVIFCMPIPRSWSKKKREAIDLSPHQSKPDIDNLTKALLDAVHEEDKQVWNTATTKLWSTKPGLIITDEAWHPDFIAAHVAAVQEWAL